MSVTELLAIGLYAIHSIAAAAWIGGSLFYLVVLQPAFSRLPEGDARSAIVARIGQGFRELTETCAILLVVTGAVMTFDRLTTGTTGPVYAAVLGLKIALAVWAFVLIAGRRRHRRPRPMVRQGSGEELEAGPAISPRQGFRSAAPALIVVLGVTIFLLASVLRVLYEMALRS